MTFDLRAALPVITTKRIFVRGVIEELLWFVSGSSDATQLARKGVHIWDHNTSRAFLDDAGLHALPTGDTGPLYGHTLRHHGAPYVDKDADYTGQGVDQLQRVVESIKADPFGRRHVLSLWNPETVGLSVLPPCHGTAVQFHVSLDGELSCAMFQRSVDAFLGLPFNVTSYALLTGIVARVCGLRPGDLKIDMGDVHIYRPHLAAAALQLTRTPLPFPGVEIDALGEVSAFTAANIRVTGYRHHPAITAELC
jgi:thymidylate synthase